MQEVSGYGKVFLAFSIANLTYPPHDPANIILADYQQGERDLAFFIRSGPYR